MGRLDAWSAIRRAGYAGFKRSIAVAIGNWLASAGARGVGAGWMR